MAPPLHELFQHDLLNNFLLAKPAAHSFSTMINYFAERNYSAGSCQEKCFTDPEGENDAATARVILVMGFTFCFFNGHIVAGPQKAVGAAVTAPTLLLLCCF